MCDIGNGNKRTLAFTVQQQHIAVALYKGRESVVQCQVTSSTVLQRGYLWSLHCCLLCKHAQMNVRWHWPYILVHSLRIEPPVKRSESVKVESEQEKCRLMSVARQTRTNDQPRLCCGETVLRRRKSPWPDSSYRRKCSFRRKRARARSMKKARRSNREKIAAMPMLLHLLTRARVNLFDTNIGHLWTQGKTGRTFTPQKCF